MSVSTLKGPNVVNKAKEDLGKIEDLMIDLENDRIAYAVLSFGGFLGMGNKLFAVPWRALELRLYENSMIITLNVDKEVLKKAEGFDKDDWPVTCEQLATSTREWLADIYTCYGCKPYWQTEVLEQTEKESSGEAESKRNIEKKARTKRRSRKS